MRHFRPWHGTLSPIFLAILLGLTATSQLLADDMSIREIDSDVDYYRKCQIHGFIVYVNSCMNVLSQREHSEMIDNLARSIDVAMSVIPAHKQAVIKKTVIWVDWEISLQAPKSAHNPTGGAVAYYSSPNAPNPDRDFAKRCGITISAKCCLHGNESKRMASDCKYWLLHEIAHAYHDSTPGFNNPKIIRVYDAAMDKRLFKDLYASADALEYFAELSVIYLAKASAYPFDRNDLKKYDERGFHLMRQMWGDVGGRDAANLIPIFRGHCCMR